jgi:predicted RNase H-like HicB family nuclease
MLKTMERTYRYVVFEQDGAFVAQCLDVDVASEGDNEVEALAALKEALELYFEGGKAPASTPGAMRFGELAVDA